MKKLYFLLAIFFFSLSQSQIINFADANFKAALLAIPGIDSNADGNITQQEAQAYTGTNVSGITNAIKIENNNLVGSVAEILYFTNLKHFELVECPQVTVVNLNQNHALETFKYKIINGKYNLMGLTPNNSIKNLYIESSSSHGSNNNPIYTSNHLFTFKTLLDLTNLTQLQKLDLIGSLPLDINGNFISSPSLVRINLDLAAFKYNNIENLVRVNDITGQLALEFLKVSNVKASQFNAPTTINITNCSNLKNLYLQWLRIQNTPLETPNPVVNYPNINNIEIFTLGKGASSNFFNLNENYFVSFTKLKELWLYEMNVDLLGLNLGNNHLLTKLHIESIFNIRNINLKNGSNLTYFYHYDYNPNFNHNVCVDDLIHYNTNYSHPKINYLVQCNNSGVPFNIMQGQVFIDMNNNQCADQIPMANASIGITNANTNNQMITTTNNSGNYLFHISTLGMHTTEPNLSAGSYSPSSDIWNTTQFGGSKTANFCVNPYVLSQNPGTTMMNDAAIVSYWTSGPIRPGFTFCEEIKLVNNTFSAITVSPTLLFNNSLIAININNNGLISVPGTLQWNNLTIPAFGTVNLNACFLVPTNFVGGETLTFNANIDANYSDNNNLNNSHVHSLTVVNSMDPNNKHVQQGSLVSISNVNNYLEYKIRFQNEGTAEAINIKISDIIDGDLNMSTFQVLASSHPVRTEIIGNEVNFYFDNINLNWAANNEPASHGWITYRIKPNPLITVGTEVENTANIFFDYNAAITTNTTTTTYVGTMSTHDVTNTSLQIYPNPTSDILNINTIEKIQKIEVFDAVGRIVLIKISGDRTLDVSGLKSGSYILKIITDKNTTSHKILKK